MVLKYTGWIIPPSAARQWFNKWYARQSQNRCFDIEPFSSIDFDEDGLAIALSRWFELRGPQSRAFLIVRTVVYPAVTPDGWGNTECLLLRRISDDSNESWSSYSDVPQEQRDLNFRDVLRKDGLEGDLEWVTIADPYCRVSFFEKYPGCPLPPEDKRLQVAAYHSDNCRVHERYPFCCNILT